MAAIIDAFLEWVVHNRAPDTYEWYRYRLQRFIERYPNLLPLVENQNPDEIGDIIAAIEGGFDLWGTTDGKEWTRISRSGFGDWYSYGIRSFVSTPFGFFAGAANPFFGFKLFLGQPKGFDIDGDGAPDATDNCPQTWNLSQYDADSDGRGDACETIDLPANADGAAGEADADGDGIPAHFDNCAAAKNDDQSDADHDGVGDLCESTVAPGFEPEPGHGGGGITTVRPCGAGAHILVLMIPLLLSLKFLSRLNTSREPRSARPKAGPRR
jgi:hypothetical protein